MKERKNFFAQNRLNKGYAKSANHKETDSALFRRRFEHVLPPVELLNEYEAINPGTLSKLIKMAEVEQENKYKLEIATIEANKHSAKMGRICALMLISLLCITTIILVALDELFVAIIFIIIGFLSTSLATFFMYRKIRKSNDYGEKGG